MDTKGMLKGVLMTAVGVALGMIVANLASTKLLNKQTTAAGE